MKAIKNYSILVISTITLIFSGCSLTGPKTNPADVIPVENDPVQIANPLEEVLIADENAEADMYDIDTIGKLLSLKYPYAPPFHLDFDHEEDGCYVFHFFEVVTNEDESHTATVDWFTVDPKTGETTTITGETFNIGDLEDD